MLISLNWLARWASTCRIKIKQAWHDRHARKSPRNFRELIQIDPDHNHPFAHQIQPWQQADFDALDKAWQTLAQPIQPPGARSASKDEPPNEPLPHHPGVRSASKDEPPPHQSGARSASKGEPQTHPTRSRSASKDKTQPARGAAAPPLSQSPRTPIQTSPPPQFIPTRAWIERPRGHSKTSDVALEIAWILLYASKPLHGLAAAADRDQASLIIEALQRIARLNPHLCKPLVFHKHVISNPHNGARLEIISSDVQSSWGQLPDFVICDELCHWDQPDLWYSLLSSAAKRPHCVLVVLTNAGVGHDWHWQAREAARQSDRWHFSSLDGPQAPWITAELLDEQRRLLPQPVFNRLWLNRWQLSDGDFVTLAEAEACIDPNLYPQSTGQSDTHYYAAIDYAEKHDYTAALLLHPSTHAACNGASFHPSPPPRRRGARGEGEPPELTNSSAPPAASSLFAPLQTPSHPLLVVDRLDLHIPTPDRPTPVAWVESWIRHIASRFQNVTFILDEYQLLGTIQSLESEFDVRRFPFRAGKGNHDLAQNLRTLLLQKRIRWYPDCGQLPSADCGGAPFPTSPPPRRRGARGEGEPQGLQSFSASPASSNFFAPLQTFSHPSSLRNDLATELASLHYRQSPSGLCRIDHKPGQHDDRAFVLGAAAVYALNTPPPDRFTITPPTETGDFNF